MIILHKHGETYLTQTKTAAGRKISIALGLIVLGIIGLILYQLYRVPNPAGPVRGDETRSALSDRSSPSGGPVRRRVTAVEMDLVKPPSAQPPLKLGEGEDPSKRSNLAGFKENQAAVEQFQSGRYEAAEELLEKAHELDPMNLIYTKNLAHAKARMAWNRVNLSEYESALPGFEKAIALYPEEFSFYLGLGLSYHHLKKETEAKGAAEKALRLAPNEPDPYKLLGEIAYQNDEIESALGFFEKALQISPGDPNLSSVIEKLRREHQVQGRFQQEATFHFTIKFEGREERNTADQVVRILEEAYGEIGKTFSYYPDNPITVILYSDQQFRDITRTPSWTGGLFDGKIRIPAEGIGSSPEILNRVLYHEYTHAVVHAMAGSSVPTWLNEGLALTFEKGDPASWDGILQGAVRAHGLIPLQSLHGPFISMDQETASLAYAESYSAVKYLIHRYGMFTIQTLLKDLSRQRDFAKAFEDRFFVSYTDFQSEWQKGLAP